ncbi:unnamed protein product [Urochloa humidicola]
MATRQHDVRGEVKVTMKSEDPQPGQANALLTGQEFPTLNFVGLSIERGALKPNATTASQVYNSNTQSVLYVTGGSFRQLQVVDNRGVAVFDGELRQGQPLLLPQDYVILAQAGKDGPGPVRRAQDRREPCDQLQRRAGIHPPGLAGWCHRRCV